MWSITIVTLVQSKIDEQIGLVTLVTEHEENFEYSLF